MSTVPPSRASRIEHSGWTNVYKPTVRGMWSWPGRDGGERRGGAVHDVWEMDDRLLGNGNLAVDDLENALRAPPSSLPRRSSHTHTRNCRVGTVYHRGYLNSDIFSVNMHTRKENFTRPQKWWQRVLLGMCCYAKI